MAESHPFGERLYKHLTRKRGLSQNLLAKSIGVDPSVIARMCKGKFPSTIDLLNERICKIVDFLKDAKVIECEDEANGFFTDVGLIPPIPQPITSQIMDNHLPENQSLDGILEIDLLMKGEFLAFDKKKKEAVILLLSELLDIDPSDINIFKVEKGSIKLTIGLPAHTVEKLNNLTNNDKEILKRAGIFRISDREKHYYIERVIKPKDINGFNVRRSYQGSFAIFPLSERSERYVSIVTIEEKSLNLSNFMMDEFDNVIVRYFHSIDYLIYSLSSENQYFDLPYFDLIIWDISNIYLDIINIRKKIQLLREEEQFKNIKIIAVSRKFHKEDFEQIYNSGFDGLISNISIPDNIPDYINRILQGETIWHID